MISQKDKDFINECFHCLYQKREPLGNYLPAKEPQYDMEDGGVPPEMFASEINNEGWVKWKFLDFDLHENEIEKIENEYNFKFPNLFRAYLTTKFHLFDEVRADNCQISLPPIPIDNPFNELRRIIRGGEFLVKIGFIPFGYYSGWDVICFDTRNLLDEKDFPVVWFDHEIIYEEMDADLIEIHSNLLFNSFEELLTKTFLDDK